MTTKELSEKALNYTRTLYTDNKRKYGYTAENDAIIYVKGATDRIKDTWHSAKDESPNSSAEKHIPCLILKSSGYYDVKTYNTEEDDWDRFPGEKFKVIKWAYIWDLV